MTSFYVNSAGQYLGGFDGAEPPQGAIEVPVPPLSASDLWVNGAWVHKPWVPQEVTRYQGYLALFDSGVTEAMIDDKLAELLEGEALARALLVRRLAQNFQRHNDLVLMIGAAFQLDLDELFIRAATIN